jgi:hydrogenase-4 component E
MVKMGSIIEFGIVFEMLILAMIMGVMIFNINKTFDSLNTDYLSNLKE